MSEQEKKIAEQRTIEATRKGLMGMAGKLGTILKYLGSPITAHGSGLYESNYFDLWDEGSEEMPYMDMPGVGEEPTGGGWRSERNYHREAVSVEEIGRHFDGLSRGLHLEIFHHEDNKELKVYFRGDLVYKEVGGELAAYAPSEEWEAPISRLFAAASEKAKTARQSERQEATVRAAAERAGWVESVKRRWGL